MRECNFFSVCVYHSAPWSLDCKNRWRDDFQSVWGSGFSRLIPNTYTTKVVSPNRNTRGSDFISATQQSSRRSCLISNANTTKVVSPNRDTRGSDFSRLIPNTCTTKVVSPNRHTRGSDFISATQQSSRRSRLISNANTVKIAPPTGKFKSERSHIDNYYLQLDIHNFFYSIDKKILLSLLARHLNSAIKKRLIHPAQGRDYYQLCVRILRRPQAKNQLSKVQLAKIPPHKQLNNVPTNKGLPIGNLTSQFFGNVYLNELDQFVKHQLKVKHFVRFVDDFVLLGSKNKCQQWQQQIEVFLAEKLQLKLKPIQILEPISNGVDFLGYIIYPHYKLVRKRVIHNFYTKLQLWQQNNILHTKKGSLIYLDSNNTDLLSGLFASYIGHIKHAKHYKILQNKIIQFPWLKLFFYNNKGCYTMTTNNKSATKFTHQHYFFNTIFNDFVVLIQKGNCFITNTIKDGEFSLKQLNATLARLQANNQSYVFISEQGYVHNKLKQRKLKQIFITHHFYNKEQNYAH